MNRLTISPGTENDGGRLRLLDCLFLPALLIVLLLISPVHPGAFAADMDPNSTLGDSELFPFVSKGRLGFMDVDGNTIIEPEYQAVMRHTKFGFETGAEIVIPDVDDVSRFSNGVARIRVPIIWWVFTLRYNDAFIDRAGDTLFVSEYDWIGTYSEDVAPFRRKVRRFEIALGDYIELFGYVGRNGEEITGAQFDWCGPFRNGLAAILVQGRYGFIKRDQLYRFHGDRRYSFNELDPLNQDILHIPAMFADVGNFHQGVAAAAEVEGSYGLIDTDGNWILKPKYDFITHFAEGHAVCVKSGKFGLIDLQGNEVIAPSNDRVGGFNDGISLIQNGNTFRFIDTSGTTLANMEYEAVGNYSEGLIPFLEGESWGFVNLKGDVVINPSFTYVKSFENGIARAWKDSEMGYISRTGEWVRRPSQ